MPPARTTHDEDVTCKKCHKRVSRKSDLPRHMKLHNRRKHQIPCKWEGCTYTALQRSNLHTHIATHTNYKGIKCILPLDANTNCNFRTTDPGSFSRHNQRFHLADYIARKQRRSRRYTVDDDDLVKTDVDEPEPEPQPPRKRRRRLGTPSTPYTAPAPSASSSTASLSVPSYSNDWRIMPAFPSGSPGNSRDVTFSHGSSSSLGQGSFSLDQGTLSLDHGSSSTLGQASFSSLDQGSSSSLGQGGFSLSRCSSSLSHGSSSTLYAARSSFTGSFNEDTKPMLSGLSLNSSDMQVFQSLDMALVPQAGPPSLARFGSRPMAWGDMLPPQGELDVNMSAAYLPLSPRRSRHTLYYTSDGQWMEGLAHHR